MKSANGSLDGGVRARKRERPRVPSAPARCRRVSSGPASGSATRTVQPGRRARSRAREPSPAGETRAKPALKRACSTRAFEAGIVWAMRLPVMRKGVRSGMRRVIWSGKAPRWRWLRPWRSAFLRSGRCGPRWSRSRFRRQSRRDGRGHTSGASRRGRP